jgi:3-oxoacyl-[acyl-carrier protein] reductase
VRLNGKVALVTGSGRGLGRATALELARRGASVLVNDVPDNADVAEACVAELGELGVPAAFVAADVRNGGAVAGMFAQAASMLGPVDILINNAGINIDGLMREVDPAAWEAVLGVNLSGPFNCTCAALPSMRDRGWGRIVNIASIVAERGIIGTPYYASSKAGLIGLTKATAAEVARRGVTVNAVAPGYLETGMMLGYGTDQLASLRNTIPMGRFGKPEEIARVVAFLASDDASYITGAVIEATGGFGL